ncbi:MAG: hypothetical protein U5K54_23085 [Cytophagales bacterium]|nr:hypothetical protein [Cytophagales bacterium]
MAGQAIPERYKRKEFETRFPGTPGGGGSDFASFVAVGAGTWLFTECAQLELWKLHLAHQPTIPTIKLYLMYVRKLRCHAGGYNGLHGLRRSYEENLPRKKCVYHLQAPSRAGSMARATEGYAAKVGWIDKEHSINLKAMH